jgi:hypothetical protein
MRQMRHDPGTLSLLDDNLGRLACGCEIGDRDQFRPLENVDNRLRAGGPMLDRWGHIKSNRQDLWIKISEDSAGPNTELADLYSSPHRTQTAGRRKYSAGNR